MKMPNHLAIKQGLTVDAVWVHPTPELVFGKVKEWANSACVDCVCIPGYWMCKPGSSVLSSDTPHQSGEKVVLALHGGGYISFSAHPDSITSNIVRGLLEHIPSVHRVFSPEYRLSKGAPFSPENPFPAALVDAIAAYSYLVTVSGFDPTDVVVEGDSAGGNLALALTRYLIEQHEELLSYAQRSNTRPLTPPGALILLSPWADLGVSHDCSPAGYFARSDYIFSARANGPEAKYAQRAFTGPLGLAAADTNPYISPASKTLSAENNNYSGWPRTFIVAGGAEMLAPSIRTLMERMSADMGEGVSEGRVCYYEAPDGVHDYIPLLWHEPERTDTLKKIGEWVDGV
jgi:acetyl esterase/lipase